MIEFPGDYWPTHEETQQAIEDALTLAQQYNAAHE